MGVSVAEVEGGAPTLQLVSGDGTLDRMGLEAFSRATGLSDKGLSYAVVAIMGPQSSGKSTLLNSLFHTKFQMMDFLKGRGQTTQGIWLAQAGVDLPTFTLVLDLEGTDGRERGEDDTAFEKQSTLFALAVADVILVNMWCHDIGREHAANKPLLKTVFQVMLRLFMPRKATLLFVIRDKTRTPIESLEPILREDLDKIWAGVPKPEQHKDSSINDFFHIEVTWLPNFEEKEEEFKERVGMLRQRFEHSIVPGEIAGDRTGVVPATALPLSVEEIWKRIKLNKDLDLPAHKVMVATVRCEQIADENCQLLLTSKEWAELRDSVESKSPGLLKFGTDANSLVNSALASYEQEAAFFEERVRKSKEEQLIARLKEAVAPVHAAAAAHVAQGALAAFQAAMDEATGGEMSSAATFAASARECTARALAHLDDALQGMEVPAMGLGVGPTRDKFAADVAAHTSALKAAKLKALQENAGEFLVAGLNVPVESILEAGRADAWDRIRQLWAREWGACRADLVASLKGFELAPQEQQTIVAAVEAQGRKAVEGKARELAQRALPLMKERFTAVFMHDSKGLPRRWTASDNIHRLMADARLASLQVLAAVAAAQLDAAASGAAATEASADARADPLEGQSGSTATVSARATGSGSSSSSSNPVLTALLPLLEEGTEDTSVSLAGQSASSEGAGSALSAESSASASVSRTERRSLLAASKLEKGQSSLRLWENVPVTLTFLSPSDCRSIWKQFKQETMFLVSQAQQAQERGSGVSWLPPTWVLGLLLVLGFDEIMWLISNPLTLLLLVAVLLFGRSVWKEVSGEDVFQHGLLPGLLTILPKVGPAVLRTVQHLVHLMNTVLNSGQDPANVAHSAHPQQALGQQLSKEQSGVYTNGTESSTALGTTYPSVTGQELRHRAAARTE